MVRGNSGRTRRFRHIAENHKRLGSEGEGKIAVLNVLGLSKPVVTPKPAVVTKPAEPAATARDDEATDIQSTLDRVNASMRNKGKSAKATETVATEDSSETVDQILARVNSKLKSKTKAKAAGKAGDQSFSAKEAALKKAHDRVKASSNKIRSTGVHV
jgi:hypothetical protein